MNTLKKSTSDEYEQGFIAGHREMARTVNEWFATEFKSGADSLKGFADFIASASEESKEHKTDGNACWCDPKVIHVSPN